VSAGGHAATAAIHTTRRRSRRGHGQLTYVELRDNHLNALYGTRVAGTEGMVSSLQTVNEAFKPRVTFFNTSLNSKPNF
jgi:hypothetical protein